MCSHPSSSLAQACLHERNSVQSSVYLQAPAAKDGQEQEQEPAKPQKTMQTVRKVGHPYCPDLLPCP